MNYETAILITTVIENSLWALTGNHMSKVDSETFRKENTFTCRKLLIGIQVLTELAPKENQNRLDI